MTYNVVKILIEKNRYTYEDMFVKLDLFYALGRITDEQYIELTGMLVAPPTVEEIPVSEEDLEVAPTDEI